MAQLVVLRHSIGYSSINREGMERNLLRIDSGGICLSMDEIDGFNDCSYR